MPGGKGDSETYIWRPIYKVKRKNYAKSVSPGTEYDMTGQAMTLLLNPFIGSPVQSCSRNSQPSMISRKISTSDFVISQRG